MIEQNSSLFPFEKETPNGGESKELPALYAGLDAAARDKTAWRVGYAAYEESISFGATTEQARWDALDVAAVDANVWKRGLRAIEANLALGAELDNNKPNLRAQENREALSLSTVSGVRAEKAENRLEDDPTQDSFVVDDSNRLYGVYDGAGGAGGNPAAASMVAARSIHESLASIYPNSKSELLENLRAAHKKVRSDVENYGEGGTAVATSVKIVEIGGKTYAGVAHAGDTRLFRYSKGKDAFEPLTEDQSRGNIIFNGFPCRHSTSSDQYLAIQVHEGDRLMLCSDGITGDWEHQFLSDAEFLDAFRKPSPTSCADRFIQLSKKVDDKTIVVVDISRV